MEDFEDFSGAEPRTYMGGAAIGEKVLDFDLDLNLDDIKPMYRKATEEELTPKTA